MQQAVIAARGAAAALFSGEVWATLLRALCSWPALLTLLLMLVTLLPILALSLLLSLRLPGVLPLVVSVVLGVLYSGWWSPVMIRRIAMIVSAQVVPATAQEFGADPAIFRARRELPVSVYRSWFWKPLLGFAAFELAALLAKRSHVPYLSDIDPRLPGMLFAAVLFSGFFVRVSLCTHVSAKAIDAVLEPRRRWWPVAILITAAAGALAYLLVQLLMQLTPATLASAALHQGWTGVFQGLALSFVFLVVASLLVTAVVTVGVVGAFAGVGVLRVVGITEGGAPEQAIHAKGAERARPVGRAAARRWPLWLALTCVSLLVAAAVLRKPLVYAVLRATEPEFQEVPSELWSMPSTQGRARTQMACAGKRGAVRLLHHAGIREDATPGASVVCAVKNNDIEMARLLVTLGADVNQTGMLETDQWVSRHNRENPVRLTPLAHAMQADRLAMVDWLLSQGAQVNDAKGGSAAPIHVAASRQCLPCVEVLKRHGADLNPPAPVLPLTLWIDASVRPVSPETIERLVALGMSPAAVGADGRGALHAAAVQANLPLVEWLLRRTDVDAALADIDGMTPLMHAGYRYPVPPEATTGRTGAVPGDTRERLAVALALLPRTPSVDGKAKLVRPRTALPWASNAWPPEAEWSLSTLAMRSPEFRRAARAAGLSFDYGSSGSTLPWFDIRPALIREAVQEMSAHELRSALWFGQRAASMAEPLPHIAASLGWIPELERMLMVDLAGAVRGTPQGPCGVLNAAAVGDGDMSPSREHSWRAVLVLIDGGLRPSECARGSADALQRSVSRRSVEQQAQWHTRTAPSP